MTNETSTGREPFDFFRSIRRTDIRKVKNVGRLDAIRLYSEQRGITWNLQVRGPARVGGGREGADFIVANAPCDAEDLRALRDAIDVFLADIDETPGQRYARLKEAVAAALDRAGYHDGCKASPSRVREASEDELDGVLVEVRDQIHVDLREPISAEEKANLAAALRAVVELWTSLG